MTPTIKSTNRHLPGSLVITPVLKRAVVIFLGIICVCLLIGLPIYSQYEKNLRTAVTIATQQRVALMQRTIHAEFNKLISDIKALSALPTLRVIVDTDHLTTSHPLINYLANVLLNDSRYDQIRILDQHGQEVIQIVHRNNRTFFTPENALKDRSDADYVKETLRLVPGQIYVSSMQRNKGDDIVENPDTPIIRLGTQLQDEFGRVKGLMILDYRAQGLLDSFNAIMADTTHEQTFMFGRNGSWLYSQGAHSVNERAPQLPASSVNAVLKHIDSQMAAVDRGQIYGSGGVYMVDWVYPLKFDPGSIPNAHLSQELGVPPSLVDHYRWQLITYIPNEAWLSKSVLRQPLGLFIMALLAILLALIVYETVAAWSYKNTLRRERERTATELENLYEDAPCGYHTLGPDGVVLRMNRTELGWLGYSRDDVVGKMHYTDLLAPESRQAFAERFAAFKEGGVVNDFRLTLMRRNGTTLPITLHATAVRDAHGQLRETRATTLDVTERHLLEQELRQQAYTDPLTGVYNRRHFFELGERQMRQAMRQESGVAVAMLDIDHFKAINDTYGHEAGDRVLIAVARACVEMLRPNDIFARLGGEEFAILFPDTSLEDAYSAANRIRESLSLLTVSLIDGSPLSVTVSIGVATLDAHDNHLEDVLRSADGRLYVAKQQGRNRVC